ncbi:MAG: hypothetical protein HYZ50_15420 [Deltaproteobacteria bacterium]|nr:hypothetical protein [Deltaproteobacteria bacterium]
MTDYYKHWTERIHLFESRRAMHEHDYAEKRRKMNVPLWDRGGFIFFLLSASFMAGWQGAILVSLVGIFVVLRVLLLLIQDLYDRLNELGDIYVFDRAPQEEKEKWRRSESIYDQE